MFVTIYIPCNWLDCDDLELSVFMNPELYSPDTWECAGEGEIVDERFPLMKGMFIPLTSQQQELAYESLSEALSSDPEFEYEC